MVNPPTPPPNNVRKRRRAEESSGNNKLWYYCSHEGLAQSGNTSLFLAVLESSHHSCTAGILLRTFCDTHTHTPSSVFHFFPFSTHPVTHSLTHSHVPLCWHAQKQAVFLRSLLELLMQSAMWTWNWKQMLNSAAKSLRLQQPYRLSPVGLSACVCMCARSRKPFPG